ncbi:MAG: 3-methyladenine DNA glycosylase [Actinobacteria bacterium]|nr:3-methyladenine DNA glycosylase [Actinomycetota bacterium]NBY15815.1 3-methyladenine DNA glycosylase [Actinomycetota bacterium]
MPYIGADTWLVAQDHHREVVAQWTFPRLNRRSLGQKHPVDDFMFEYYPISVNKLSLWHPGTEFQLEVRDDCTNSFDLTVYEVTDVVQVRAQWLLEKAEAISKDIDLLKSTLKRSARTGCFGLHEWAMVLGQTEYRHNDWNLRISQAQVAKTIDEIGLRCTHFDAFRFFTEQARPMNPLQLTRADQNTVEQPGCLHANMDLYKISMRWAPVVGSSLVRQCFRLAREIRTLDMRGAPYDLADLGVAPIKIETAAGRKEFTKMQKAFSDRAQVLRSKILSKLEQQKFASVTQL